MSWRAFSAGFAFSTAFIALGVYAGGKYLVRDLGKWLT